MSNILTDVDARIIGALIEKQLTTPEYYPLTLNALVNACNQKNNRDPVVHYDEATVDRAIEVLRDRSLVYVFYGSTSRVPKYKHMLPSVFELEPPETAIIAVLMLRGPQTLGELRGRTDRMHEFADLGSVQETLDGLMRRETPLVARIEKLPGRKEARFAHLLSGEIDMEAIAAEAAAASVRSRVDHGKVEQLEAEIAELRAEIESLKTTFEEFRKQFE